MEDFDYIDALAKSELSGREATPSKDGWSIVQEKLARKRKNRRLLLFLLLFIVIGSVGVYQVIHYNTAVDVDSVVNTNTEQLKTETSENSNATIVVANDSLSNSTSDSDSISTSEKISQAEKDELTKNDHADKATQQTQKLQGSANEIVKASSKAHSRESDIKSDIQYKGDKNTTETITNTAIESAELETSEDMQLEAKGAKLYDWSLLSPETLKKKRRKKEKKKSIKDIYQHMDIMVGTNGFFSQNDYQLLKSYVVEVSFEFHKELKNDYQFNYGTGLQLRNLHYKKDSIRFNKGELSVNIFSNVEKRFGDFSIEAGAYIGYEIYSPNNQFFNDKVRGFFDKKINYGLSTGVNYKNVGLIFKYEISPYINFVGDKKYGGFIIGVKYDF